MEQVLMEELSKLDPAREVAWSERRVYAQFIAQTYYYVCHSTRLLGLAAGRLSVAQEKVHQRFLKHAAEERSHHLLAERDLAALGHSLSGIPELPATAALYQVQYYWVEHVSPVALFGYILSLEGLAVKHGPAVYERICAAHGKEAARFIHVHANEDPDHVPKAFEVVASLSAADRGHVQRNLILSCALYRNFLRAINEAA